MKKLLFMVALVVTVACAAQAYMHDPIPSAELTVVNRNLQDVTVYVLRDGQRFRLGLVTSMMTTHLHIPGWAMGGERTIRLMGDPIGSPEYVYTELIHVQEGQRIEWWIETNIDRSSVMVL